MGLDKNNAHKRKLIIAEAIMVKIDLDGQKTDIIELCW